MGLRTILERMLKSPVARGRAVPEEWWDDVPVDIQTRVFAAAPEQRPLELNRIASEAAATIANGLTSDTRDVLADERRMGAGFDRRLHRRWAPAFDAYRLAITVDREVGVRARDRYAEALGDDPRFSAIVSLHARSCLTSREILSLISHGYGKGAEARWRTLHELAVTAIVLREASGEISQRYLEHASIRHAKDAEDFQAKAQRMGEEPLDAATLEALRQTRVKLLDKWGARFDRDNGWAAPLFGHPPTFTELEKRAELDHLRPYYNLGLHQIHAGARGAQLALFERGGQQMIQTGPGNTGFAEIAHASLISMTNITVSLLLLPKSPSYMAVVLTGALRELVRRAGDLFGEIELKIRAEEEALYPPEVDTSAASYP